MDKNAEFILVKPGWYFSFIQRSPIGFVRLCKTRYAERDAEDADQDFHDYAIG